jgi:branched-chain amino acid transport system ATP-binding protein
MFLADGQTILSIKGLRKSFGGLLALNDVDFDIFPGQIVGLIGPNGAGKTTLFHLVSGFYKPDHGTISFKSTELTGLRADQICKIGISRAFQIVRPFIGLTVFQNVLIGSFNRAQNRREAHHQCLNTLELTGLTKFKDQLANHLTLAGKKRLEIAKALSTTPEVLLLDEVMAGLTPVETEEIMALIRTINSRGITIIAIEHVMAAIMSLSHRIVVLNYGEKIAEGSPEEIANNEDVIGVYLGEERETA